MSLPITLNRAVLSRNEGQTMKRLLWHLAIGTKGGKTRFEIIRAVRAAPRNTNQLAVLLKKDYNTVSFHLRVLEKNRIVVSVGSHYAKTFFLSQAMEENYVEFEGIAIKKIGVE